MFTTKIFLDTEIAFDKTWHTGLSKRLWKLELSIWKSGPIISSVCEEKFKILVEGLHKIRIRFMLCMFTPTVHRWRSVSFAVNKQNFRYWSHNNPRELHHRPLHSPKVTVWCAIFQFLLWGPYFFEEDSVTVTVTSFWGILQYYRIFSGLNWIIFSMNMEQKMCGFNKMVQQPTHLVVRSEFSDKCFLGPPRSPDFTSCNFFFLGLRQSSGVPTSSPNFERS
jgi:hypothetical protein